MENSSELLSTLFGLGFMFFWLAVYVVFVVGNWKAFEKAGQEGWKSLIPVYNLYVLQVITFGESKGLYFLAFFVPFVGSVYPFYLLYNQARAYGLSQGLAIANIFFPPFVSLYIGFSKDVAYVGPQEFLIK